MLKQTLFYALTNNWYTFATNQLTMNNFLLRSCNAVTLLFATLICSLAGYGQCVLPNPTVSNANTTCGQSVTLTASGGNSYNWYSNAAGSQLIGTGSTFITPILNTNTTYYVQSV
jgi:hypothetical protein